MSDTAQPDAAENTSLEAPEGPQTAETPQPEMVAPKDANEESGFPRDYVERLRRENATYRQKAKEAEQAAQEADAFAGGFAQRLHRELVRATGLLADPADLEFQIEHLADEDNLREAIDQLLAEKPHLRSRKPSGDVGQGNRGQAAEFSLLDVLKSHA